MLEIFQKLITLLTADTNVTDIVGNNIFTGQVDITMEKQADLLYPSIVLFLVSETQNTVPLDTRETDIQIDLWSRNSAMEIENLYEAVINCLSYYSGGQSQANPFGNAHIFWQVIKGAVDQFESDRRVWHRAVTLKVWTRKAIGQNNV